MAAVLVLMEPQAAVPLAPPVKATAAALDRAALLTLTCRQAAAAVAQTVQARWRRLLATAVAVGLHLSQALQSSAQAAVAAVSAPQAPLALAVLAAAVTAALMLTARPALPTQAAAAVVRELVTRIFYEPAAQALLA